MEFAPRSAAQATAWAIFLAAACGLAPATVAANDAIRFQKPGRASTSAPSNADLKFKNPSAPAAPAASGLAQKPKPAQPAATEPAPELAAEQASYETAKPIAAAPRVAQREVRQAPAKQANSIPTFAQPSAYYLEDDVQYYAPQSEIPRQRVDQASYLGFGGCTTCAEPLCGCAEPTCGICEAVCGCAEPACGMEAACGMEPACGIDPGCGMEPDCGLVDPGCGCDDLGCGSCVGNPGPDYWCFPVCLPRLKEFTVWGGVHGFKGPRDVFDGGTDGNFGFQEGFNVGGRAPLVGLLFPQLSYQLGYQAVQSRLHGSSAGAFAPTDERNQDFLTVGLFRRVPAGLQFGAVFDAMNDDFRTEADFHQMRYEISIKSQQGREIGFWGATHTNSEMVGGRNLQAVDQYAAFLRWSFRESGEIRFWGGGTNDEEGLFGADFYVPFNNRWSLDTGFNYLITDAPNGPSGAQEESWNIGMNLTWHYGRTAKQARRNPHRPMFSVADNGWMFIDEAP